MGKTIALAGMFNMNNFGDLLFPVVADHCLKKMNISVVSVAATAEKPLLQTGIELIDLDDLARDISTFSGVVIGGGHMIHTLPIGQLIDSAKQMPPWTGAGLWLGVSLLAAQRNLPILWNAPGVPHPLPRSRHKLTSLALAAADYRCVRDRGSAELLKQAGANDIGIAPDTIGIMDDIWPRDSLAAEYEEFCHRTGLTPNDRIISFHARDRSLPEGGVIALTQALSRLANEFGVVPVLHGLGQAHKDQETARMLSEHMTCRHVIYDQQKSLKEVASVLAFSTAYIGSSLHGYIVAEAYGRTSLLIGKPAYKKFIGYLEHSKQTDDLFPNWEEGLEGLARRLHTVDTDAKIASRRQAHQDLKAAIQRHFQQLAATLDRYDPEKSRLKKTDFVSLYRETLASANQSGWLYTPPWRSL